MIHSRKSIQPIKEENAEKEWVYYLALHMQQVIHSNGLPENDCEVWCLMFIFTQHATKTFTVFRIFIW